jgi:hypothetical protein
MNEFPGGLKHSETTDSAQFRRIVLENSRKKIRENLSAVEIAGVS